LLLMVSTRLSLVSSTVAMGVSWNKN